MLLNLEPKGQQQMSLFEDMTPGTGKRTTLLGVIDQVNREMGRDTLWTAAQGLTLRETTDSWRMQRGDTVSGLYDSLERSAEGGGGVRRRVRTHRRPSPLRVGGSEPWWSAVRHVPVHRRLSQQAAYGFAFAGPQGEIKDR